MQIECKKFLIIGAGPTALGAAYRLQEMGENDFLLCEKEKYVGGLSTSFVDAEGFTWDVGGHVQFSHYSYFDQVMRNCLGDAWFLHERESWVWIFNRFIPYPLQNNIHRLPDLDMQNALSDLKKCTQRQHPLPDNFEQWIKLSFGQHISNIFMLPYNFKVWATPLDKMSYQWIGERVSTVDLQKIQENIKNNSDDRNWGPNNKFQFPKVGGTGAIWTACAQLLAPGHINLDTHLIKVDLKEKTATFKQMGKIVCYKYQHLLSTIPLKVLAQMCQGMPTETQALAQNLEHSTTHVFGIGLKGQAPSALNKKCWMYFPQDDCPFYRVTVFSHYSPHNVPDAQTDWSLMAEVSESRHKPVNRQTILAQVIQGMLKTKLILRQEDIISTWHHTAPFGYPIPTLDRDKILSQVLPLLHSAEVYSRGRFGGWKYEVSNQDHSFMQGVEWAEYKVLGTPEKTFHL